ncbi:MAG: hypothetical protein NXH72_08410 [Hyphomonadaceae bacterium]|nr:hypothetical protein [Hyphomonadaceae bacterium]
MLIRVLLASLVLAIAACSTVPIYQPASDRNDFGYSEQQIEPERYRVTYNGDDSTSQASVENFLLYRMAEITLEQDYDYFKVINMNTECHTEYHTTVDQDCPGGSEYGQMFPYCGYGYICNPSGTLQETKRYEAVAFMTLHHGEPPVGEDLAYAAREVEEQLRDQIVRE